MTNIQNELNNIKNAIYGKDVRNSIHDAIKTCYDDASINNDNANMEVKLARGTYDTLNDRLCEVDEKQNSLSSQLAHNENEINILLSKTDFVYPEMFGAIGDGATDDTEAFNKMFNTNKRIRFIKDATYKLGNIPAKSNLNIKSEYNTTLKIYKNSDNPVLIGFGSNSIWENIKIISNENSLEWNRGDITNRENIVIKNCTIEGFRHISSRPNAWGLYLENSRNIRIENCVFNDNTQSDIAIVDGCENIVIDNCKGNALHINFEPNGSATLKNVLISNCNIDRLNTLENSYKKVLIDGVILTNCTINNYYYRGGNVTLNNTKVNNYNSDGDLYMGVFNDNFSLHLSKNIIDAKIVDYGNTSSDGCCWYSKYMPESNSLERGSDIYGEYLLLNPNNSYTIVQFATKVNVTPSSVYCLELTSSSIYSTSSSWLANHGIVNFYDLEGQKVGSKKIIVNQSTVNTTVKPQQKRCFIKIPVDVASIELTLSNTNTDTTSQTQFKIYDVKLSKVDNICGVVKYNDNKNYVIKKPSQVYASGSKNFYIKGQKVYLKEPVAGGYLGFVCTASGNPGVWKGFGLIES